MGDGEKIWDEEGEQALIGGDYTLVVKIDLWFVLRLSFGFGKKKLMYTAYKRL